MSILSARLRRHLFLIGMLSTSFPAEAREHDQRQDFSAYLLGSHNSLRTEAGVPPLVWDSNLQAQASTYAAYLSNRNVFVHSSPANRGGGGENLWMGTRNAFTFQNMFGGWASEESKFRPGVFPAVSRSGNWHDVGHYTQIVWPQTKRVGCALASNASNDFLVCRYWPAGNVQGEPLVQRLLASN